MRRRKKSETDPGRQNGDGLILLVSVDVSGILLRVFGVTQHRFSRILILKKKEVHVDKSIPKA